AGAQDVLKLDYVVKLGADKTVCIGNGRNDLMMIREAKIGIAVIQEEGSCGRTLSAADIVCTSIIDALNLLLHPQRLSATLRNG
ncbi:MAG: ATPase P, partial [Calditrichaeota bacterium]